MTWTQDSLSDRQAGAQRCVRCARMDADTYRYPVGNQMANLCRRCARDVGVTHPQPQPSNQARLFD